MRAALGVIILSLLATPLAATAPHTSPHPVARSLEADRGPAAVRPVARPQAEDLAQVVGRAAVTPLGSTAILMQIRPRLRPVSEQITQAAARPQTLALMAPSRSLRPWLRPPAITQKAMARKRAARKGSVCGDIEIQGEEVGRVPGRIKACGITDAVRVKSVSGVRLSQGSLMNCPTAKALRSWVDNGVKPAFRRRGPVVELKVAAHYACRTRNNQPGGRISEHGKGNAIDISGFVMKDGEVVTVLKGWGRGTTLKPLRQVWKAACGPFGTVLGPESDRFHRDHFHFDTARYRNGTYCR